MKPSLYEEAADSETCSTISPIHNSKSQFWVQLFSECKQVFSSFQEDAAEQLRQISYLEERWHQGKFFFAILGQFKRGKSTLINALLGEPLLPTAVVPLTAIPTFIQYGIDRTLDVQFSSDDPPVHKNCADGNALSLELSAYVTEEENAKNAKNVMHVLVHHPSPFLSRGVVLIDTPGIGSVYRHNTEATLQFLPQCDAAVFLISSDPPITDTELQFLKIVQQKISQLFYIINKTDYLSEDEREQFVSHFRDVLSRDEIGVTAPSIFCVSAKRGLEAKSRGDEGLWNSSGMESVEKYLADFLVTEKNEVLAESLIRKAGTILRDFHLQVQLEIKALQLPIHELEERLQLFRQSLIALEREQIALIDLLRGEQRRLTAFLEELASSLRQKAIDYLHAMAERELLESAGVNETAILESVAEAIPIFFERELGETARDFEGRVEDILKPYRQRAIDLLNSIKTNAVQIFEISLSAESTIDFFKMEKQPYWVTHKWSTGFIPIPIQWFETWLPISRRKKRVERRITEQIEGLVLNNVENLRWATLQNLNNTFRRFSSQLSLQIQETISVTRMVIERSLQKRKENSESILKEIHPKEQLADEIQRLILMSHTIDSKQKGIRHADEG